MLHKGYTLESEGHGWFSIHVDGEPAGMVGERSRIKTAPNGCHYEVVEWTGDGGETWLNSRGTAIHLAIFHGDNELGGHA